ncbi:sigma-54 dependent transcriptional regulator [Myxococcota bacterium]|nr:sigma-54 dependent transcriptional regulator [Myxococcota bacterium]
MPERVLLVEDRESLRNLLGRALIAGRLEVVAVGDAEAAIARLREEPFAVVVSDVRLPGADGATVLRAARALPTPPEVVLMTAYAEVPAAVSALRDGAYDYLAKPFEPEELLRVVRRAAERFALVGRARELEALLDDREGGLIGRAPSMLNARRLIERVAPLTVPVLLRGESGTGKEVAARELHRLSGRGPMVAKGAFTGAGADRVGLIEAAAGGTLFLDEIGELPLALQVKLNRVLEEGELRRVGETAVRPLQARIIAATHRDLEAAVREGKLRADLYFRLKVVQIELPPLRERLEDLPLLVGRFLRHAAARYGARARSLSPEALAAVEAWAWPGNVRELRHALEHAAVMSEDEVVGPLSLPPELRREGQPAAETPTYRDFVERAELAAGRQYLTRLMQQHQGNVSKAAPEAGVERETLHRLLRRHGVDPAAFRGAP